MKDGARTVQGQRSGSKPPMDDSRLKENHGKAPAATQAARPAGAARQLPASIARCVRKPGQHISSLAGNDACLSTIRAQRNNPLRHATRQAICTALTLVIVGAARRPAKNAHGDRPGAGRPASQAPRRGMRPAYDTPVDMTIMGIRWRTEISTGIRYAPWATRLATSHRLYPNERRDGRLASTQVHAERHRRRSSTQADDLRKSRRSRFAIALTAGIVR